jgi:hypothetical protein
MGTLRFDQYQREAKVEPLDLELPDGTTVTIPVPDGGQFMAAEEAGSTRKALRVVCGDAWEKVEPLVKSIKDPEALKEFVRDVMTYFRMTEGDAPSPAGPR